LTESLQDIIMNMVIHYSYFIFVASYMYKISKLLKFMTILSLKGVLLVWSRRHWTWSTVLFPINLFE